jgi:hypothetical protein
MVGFAGIDHVLGVGQCSGNGFLTEDGPCATLGNVYCDLRMQVIRCGNADNLGFLLCKHFSIVGVVAHIWPYIAPKMLKFC